MAQISNNRRSNSGSPVAVGIIAFLLGFLFAFIVLFGSIFGVGYVAATTDINEVFRVFGLENEKKDSTDPDDQYNYINAEQAPNIYSLITKIMDMANQGLGEINLNKIDALAPITDTVLDMGYEFIDEVVDLDKDYFKDVPLTSIIDVVKNSLYYVHTAKIVETLNSKMGYSIDLEQIPIVGYLVDGVEANYATVKGMDESFRLPVLFDYYVYDGPDIGYSRTVADNGTSAYPANFNGDYSFIHETTLKNVDGEKLYRVYYVPCKVTDEGIKEADYEVEKIEQEDPNVTYSKNGETVKLKYTFRAVDFGEDTDFIAVKSEMVDGIETFTLDYDAIYQAKSTDSTATASERYIGYSYYEDYARHYYTGPSTREENNLIYGVSTVNNINFFKNVAGEVVEYDPLLVSDIMLSPLHTLDQVPVATVVNADQADVVRGIFGDTPLGDILGQRVNFNELVDDIELATFLDDVKVDDEIMSYIVYNITDVKDDGAGNYTAIYDKDGANLAVKVKVEGGVIKGLVDADDAEVKGNTVADMTSLTDGLTIDVFMDVKADDAIMAYIGYGVTDVYKVDGKDYGYVGTCEGNEVRIYTDAEGNITKVVDANGVEIDGTKIDGVSDRINSITDVLALNDFIDVDPEEAILSYIGYGIYDIEAAAGTDYNYVGTYDVGGTEYPAYISAEVKDGKNVISSAWYVGADSNKVNISGTKIDGVSDRINNITNVMSLPTFIDVDPEEAILSYIGYGIYDIEAATGTDYNYVGTYDVGGTEYPAYISAEVKDGKNVVSSAWYVGTDSKKVKIFGTKIGKVSDRLDNITNVLTLPDFIDVDPEEAILSYIGYGIYDIEAVAGTDYNYVGTYDVGGTEYPAYISAEVKDGKNVITSAWYVGADSNKVNISGTKINKVSDMLDNITNVLAITEFIDIKASDSIMAYVGYGVNKVTKAPDGSKDSLGNSYGYTCEYSDGTGVKACYIAVNAEGNATEVWYVENNVKHIVKGTKIGAISDRISKLQDTLTIGELVEVKDNSSMILKALKDTTVSGLDAKINTLTVANVLKPEQINNNSVLPQLRNTKITQLDSAIDEVLIQRIYADSIYEGFTKNADPKLATEYNSQYLYYVKDAEGNFKPANYDPTKTGTEYDDNLGKLTQEQFNSGEYYTYGQATGMWKLVLYRTLEDGTKTEKAYTLNNFNNMVAACSETVYNSTLGELQEAGIIDANTDLTKCFKAGIDTTSGNQLYFVIYNGTHNTTTDKTAATKMQDLTLKEFLDFVNTVLGA